MNRRQFISATAVGATGLAGCSRRNSTSGSGDGESTGSDGITTSDGSKFNPPDARFSIEEPGLDDRRTLTITHDEGESIPARELFVRGDGITEGSTGPFHEIEGSGFDPEDEVSPGDSFEITIRDENAAFEVTVKWQSAEGDSMVYTQASRGESQSA